MATFDRLPSPVTCDEMSALPRQRDSAAKTAIDLCGSLLLILLLSPLFLGIALILLIADGTPILHRRRVLGTKGDFDAFKFRTMRRDADAMLHTNASLRCQYEDSFKLKADPRVTRIGAVLRKFSLDELPQLFNVFRGQMSLVGPRMITAPELVKYGEYQELLLSIKPGLTGYWQVYGRQEVSYEERVRMDVKYIRTWTFWKDMHLLLLTPWRVIRGRGAY